METTHLRIKRGGNSLTRSISIAALTAGSLALGGAALADSHASMAVESIPVAPASQAHDWSGWYGDIYWGRWINPPVANYGGVNIGYLGGSGSLLFGGELGVMYDPSLLGGYTQVTLDARVGTAVSDTAMVFGNLGLGVDNFGVTFAEYSIGAQYSMMGSAYLRGEAIGQSPISIPGPANFSLRLGLGWEF